MRLYSRPRSACSAHLTLALYTNWLALWIAILGLLVYAGLYTCIKRYSHWATEVGSIAGAIPPLVGYVAVTGAVDLGGVILFVILALWQMPHFFAISIYRRDEYAAARVPVRSVAQGVARTKVYLLAYTLVFIPAVFALPYFGFAGPLYLVLMAGACAGWLSLAVRGFFTADEKRWARQTFFLFTRCGAGAVRGFDTPEVNEIGSYRAEQKSADNAGADGEVFALRRKSTVLSPTRLISTRALMTE